MSSPPATGSGGAADPLSAGAAALSAATGPATTTATGTIAKTTGGTTPPTPSLSVAMAGTGGRPTAPPHGGHGAAAAQVRREAPPVKVVAFYGEPSKKDGKASCMDFIEAIDRAARLNNWSAADAAECAYENLMGKAKQWAARLQRSIVRADNLIVADWNIMRNELAKRFDEIATPAQKVNAISNIAQAQEESAKDYYDRIRGAFDFMVRDEFARQPPENWDGYMACFENIFTVFYLKGLNAKTRCLVATDMTDDTNLDKLIEKVEQVDKALLDEKRQSGVPAGIAGISVDEDKALKEAIKENQQLQAQIASMTGGRGGQSSRGRGRGGQSGTSRPAPGKGEGMRTPMQDRGWIWCYACKNWGQHFAKECKLTKEEIERLPKEKMKERPEGNPFDRQFNTRKE